MDFRRDKPLRRVRIVKRNNCYFIQVPKVLIQHGYFKERQFYDVWFEETE